MRNRERQFFNGAVFVWAIFIMRLAQGKAVSKKRQTPAPIPARLLAHLRRWVRLKIAKEFFVEWGGKPVKRVSKGFRHGVKLAGLSAKDGRVVPHTAAHGGDMAYASWRRSLDGRWLPGNDRGNARAQLRPPPPGPHERRSRCAFQGPPQNHQFGGRIGGRENGRSGNCGKDLVGVAGFEPATPSSRTRCATRLRYTPPRRPVL